MYKCKIKSKNLKSVLILCTYNIKGLTEKQKIETYMPIKEDDLIIYVEYNKKIVVMKNNKKVGEVLSDNNTYSNLEILKLITSTYGIECKGDDILNLLKYRSKIIAIFI